MKAITTTNLHELKNKIVKILDAYETVARVAAERLSSLDMSASYEEGKRFAYSETGHIVHFIFVEEIKKLEQESEQETEQETEKENEND